MRPSATARRYAEAAFEVAQQTGNAQQWVNDLEMASRAVQDTDLAQMFRDPNISEEEQLQALDEAFAKLDPKVRNLLRILVLRHRLHLLPAITQEFISLDREARGVVEAHVTVARPISTSERQEIAQRLSAATGKTVEIHTAVDPSILGGVIVRMGDRLIDASVSGRLERLRQSLAV